jgi:hypothetical protein|tara:strand:- start:427 stop:642 length:216 start_codon:yes stop_codon:yes gene_type:complete
VQAERGYGIIETPRRKAMQPQEITIIIHSDIDPSQLLDIANEYGERIAEEVETYGETAVFHEEETSVQDAA